jgi:hypothetical protein
MMPYILSLIGVTALFFIGRKRWWGWVIAWGNECLWVAFAVTTQQYGFILGAAVYGTINMANAIVWKRDAKKEKPAILH